MDENSHSHIKCSGLRGGFPITVKFQTIVINIDLFRIPTE